MDERVKKCNQKPLAYTVCLFSLIIIPTLSIICVAMPEQVLFEVYYFESSTVKTTVLYATTATFFNMFFASLLLAFGIKEGKSLYILVWILVMVVSWNMHLVFSVFSASNFVIEGLEEEFSQNYGLILVFFGLVVWLATIIFMWFYWKEMKSGNNNVSNFAELVALKRRRAPPNEEEAQS
nr:PREDICTED: uncharacterized protein LOC107398169 [Tribolium castaneum]|eukprot:XP_015836811.1 PREDICTED: uncharacterized protein LOC107398169 [Tribolium castaneum]